MEIRIKAKKLLHKACRSFPTSLLQFLLLAAVSQALLLLLLRRTTLRDSRRGEPRSRRIGQRKNPVEPGDSNESTQFETHPQQHEAQERSEHSRRQGEVSSLSYLI